MALKLKYTDEHGILHINMSPTASPRIEPGNLVHTGNRVQVGNVVQTGNRAQTGKNQAANRVQVEDRAKTGKVATGNRVQPGKVQVRNVVQTKVQPATPKVADTGGDDNGNDIDKPQFDTINNRFNQYDLFGGKYDSSSGDEKHSLFRSRYNSVEEELANTPYAFADRPGVFDITIRAFEQSPSKDIEDDRFFYKPELKSGSTSDDVTKSDDLFGPTIEPSFTVKQLIHAQDRYFDLSARTSSSVKSVRIENDAFKVIGEISGDKERAKSPVVPTAKRKRESSFAIIAEPPTSRPSSPRSLPDARSGRTSPFRGRGFREETSRHNTPKTSAANSLTNSRTNSRANSPPRRRTHSLSRIDKMATQVLPPPPIPAPVVMSRPHSPRNFVKQNIEEVRELSELNREKHEAEAERMRIEEEEALLKEMGLQQKSSRVSSRASSPTKKGRSRSSSPTAILHYENIDVPEPVNVVNGVTGVSKAKVEAKKAHKSRDVRTKSVSISQPQSNAGSPKSKIPKRQSSVSPNRIGTKRIENNLSKNQRFISNSTSSIHETIKIGSSVHDKRVISKSSNNLHLSPAHIKSKPPISPGRGGPPPSNKAINTKRLSPIVGTPNKSPVEDKTPKPSPITKKPVKITEKGKVPANMTSRLNSRQPNKTASRDPSPDKRKGKPPPKPINNKVERTPSTTRNTAPKNDVKKPITRTSSVKNLTRTPSTKTLNERPPTLTKRDSKKDLTQKTQSTTKIDEVGAKKMTNGVADEPKETKKEMKSEAKSDAVNKVDKADSTEEVSTQDNETQYDKITNDNGELIILTKKNIVSMTTAAITSQPLEIVTTVTNQLPAAFEKAREKGIFERNSSKDSLAPKNETDTAEEVKVEEKKPVKPKALFTEDNVKLKPLQPPYNNPQVERVKQKIDDILKTPEVSKEKILADAAAEVVAAKNSFKNIAGKTKSELKQSKDEAINKLIDVKDQAIQQKAKAAEEIRNEATKIVNSIITPVEEPKDLKEMVKHEVKKDIEPIVMVVNEKNGPKMTETLVKGEADVEVQSSNLSTPGKDKMAVSRMADGGSDKSSHNGGFPQSTSTTPKPPARAHRASRSPSDKTEKEPTPDPEKTGKKENICKRFFDKCAQKTKCCTCCVKPDAEDQDKMTAQDVGQQDGGKQDDKKQDGGKKEEDGVEKKGFMSKFSCCKRKDMVEEEMVKEVEKAAGKQPSIEFENELPAKRTIRDIICCRGSRRISDSSLPPAEAGCCGRRRDVERRDSVLSDREPTTCCNNRLFNWLRGSCRRREPSVSRRASMFSKNKSLSPTLPPEDTRKKLDPTLVEHTSVIRAAIPVLPIVLAYFCLGSNVLVPGLGTILSGMFCLCFGIPRFAAHDGAKYRIGAFIVNTLVGCGQLFTVLFCLVGWGWSIWWGVIMLRVARKYRRLKAEAAADEEQQHQPVTTNNHATA